jgi:hypothetical protein
MNFFLNRQKKKQFKRITTNFIKMNFFSYFLSYLAFAALFRLDMDPFLNFILCSGSVWFFYHYSEYEFLTLQNFRALPFHKQSYIVSNIVKASFLLVLCGLSLPALLFMTESVWSTREILYVKNLGALYAALDFTSIFYNQAMSKTTLFHHICVLLFFLQNYRDPYDETSVCRLIMFYAMFSSSAFYINLVLALRYLCPLSQDTYSLSFWIFLTTTFINWYVQWTQIQVVPTMSLLFYLIPLSFVAIDDVILLRWLHRRATIMN